MKVRRVPLAQRGDSKEFSIGRNAYKREGPGERNTPLYIESASVDAQFIADMSEDAIAVQSPQIAAGIGDLPIESAQHIVGLCVQQNGANDPVRLGARTSAAVNQAVGIECQNQLVRAEPGEGFLVDKIAQDLLRARGISQRLHEDRSSIVISQLLR